MASFSTVLSFLSILIFLVHCNNLDKDALISKDARTTFHEENNKQDNIKINDNDLNQINNILAKFFRFLNEIDYSTNYKKYSVQNFVKNFTFFNRDSIQTQRQSDQDPNCQNQSLCRTDNIAEQFSTATVPTNDNEDNIEIADTMNKEDTNIVFNNDTRKEINSYDIRKKKIDYLYNSNIQKNNENDSSCKAININQDIMNLSTQNVLNNLMVIKTLKIVSIGGGSWGTAVAKIVARNISNNRLVFPQLQLLIHDEIYNDKLLSTIINELKENVKYLPNVKLPDNIIATTNYETALIDADLIIFGVPDQFVRGVTLKMKPYLKENVKIVALTKGLEFINNELKPITEVLASSLKISSENVCVLSGANLALEVANDTFSEATLACKNKKDLEILKTIFNYKTFQVSTVTNVEGPQMCGALKNVIALGKGFLEGLNQGLNTQAAFIRLGFEEMKHFISLFFDVPDTIYSESCCIADLFVTCMGGRHQKIGREFAKNNGNISLETLENKLLNGQKLQGTYVSNHINGILLSRGLLGKFPIFSAIYNIIFKNTPPNSIILSMSSSAEL